MYIVMSLKLSKKRLSWAALAIYLLFLATLSCFFLVLLSKNVKNNNKTSSCFDWKNTISTLNREQRIQYWRMLRDIVWNAEYDESTIVSSKLKLLYVSPKSPQWKALQWMILEDPLAYDFATKLSIQLNKTKNHRNWTTNDLENPVYLHQRIIQRYSLAVVYYSSGGEQVWQDLPPNAGWLNHSSSRNKNNVYYIVDNECSKPPIDECSWEGVECRQDRITKDNIVGLNFSASSAFVLSGMMFPSSITLLTKLEYLVISNQGLQGTLPNQLYTKLTNLKHLDLNSNQLTRAFHGINLNASNEIVAQVDKYDTKNVHLGMLTKLEFVSFGDNELVETLPSLSALSSLRHADFQKNEQLVGKFWESAVPFWSNIEYIDISDTSLSGSIPDLKDNISFRHLKFLGATATAITGSLPHSLSAATGLKSLSISDPKTTGLYGTFPTEYGMLTDLSYGLFNNLKGLTGTLPTEYGNWKTMNLLNIYGNQGLSGTIPTELGQMTMLTSLKLSLNQLKGTIPSELGYCKLLRELFLVGTELSGSMPSEICSLKTKGELIDLETACNEKSYGTAQIECPTPDCCTSCVIK